MNKYFRVVGEILNTTLDNIVSIFEQDDIHWSLRYKNASTLFIKLDDKVDGIVYTHRSKDDLNDYLMEANVMDSDCDKVKQVISGIGQVFEKNDLVYNFEVYAQNGANENEAFEIKHPQWGKKEDSRTIDIYTYIQSIFPPEWLSKMYNDFEEEDDPEAGVDISHPDNLKEDLTVLVLPERIGVGILQKKEQDILLDLGGFDYTFEHHQLTQAKQFFKHFRETGKIKYPE